MFNHSTTLRFVLVTYLRIIKWWFFRSWRWKSDMFQYFTTILYVHFKKLWGGEINLGGWKSLCSLPSMNTFLCCYPSYNIIIDP